MSASSGTRARSRDILGVVAQALNRATDVGSALERTLELAEELLGFETGWVWLRDPQTLKCYLAASHNLPPFLQKPIRMTGTTCWCIEALRAGEFSSVSAATVQCSRLRPAVMRNEVEATRRIAYHASVVLRFGGRDLGIMNLTKPGFSKVADDELALLTGIADQLGVALERARLAEQATQVARLQARGELARDLHDTFTQDLTAIALQLETALQYLDKDPQQAGSRVSRALDVARTSVARARRSVEALRDRRRDQPLNVALHSLARAFTSQTGIVVHVELATTALDPRLEDAIEGIVTEALTNVRRHARASNVWLQVRRTRARVHLRVRDDGIGYAGTRTIGRFGVAGMRERAQALDGTLTLRTSSEGGTELRAMFPAVAG